MRNKRKIELSIFIAIVISLFLHVIIAVVYISYSPDNLDFSFKNDASTGNAIGGRDVVINMNEDEKKDYTKKTLLSDKDSSAKGHITGSKGDTWLNNSRDFRIKGSNSAEKNSAAGKPEYQSSLDTKKAFPLTPQGATLFIASPKEYAFYEAGDSEWTKIPDIKGISRKNSLYYSNAGTFSFNTAKFRDAAYFQKMKNKIASNWYPPMLSNATFMGYGGSVRFRMVQSQEVVMYFKMNRTGDVTEVKILDSMGNEQLDGACLDAIRSSKNFGQVPDDMKGDEIYIPFIFGYYIQ
jgi:TonB family protein